jgi:hypothetical protein
LESGRVVVISYIWGASYGNIELCTNEKVIECLVFPSWRPF